MSRSIILRVGVGRLVGSGKGNAHREGGADFGYQGYKIGIISNYVASRGKMQKNA